MAPIHDSASDGYAQGAGTYVRGRPDYPAETTQWLRDVVGLQPGRRVLDLGAGTGKFIPRLAVTGATVIAVEPVAAMRAELSRLHPGVAVHAGNAEAIPLPDASVDAVVCAQAFHWFATTAALAEIRRVLVPGGVLALVWNVRDTTVPWVAALTALTDVHEGDTPRHASGAWRRVFPADGFEALGEQSVRHDHVGPADQVIVQRTLSTSFIAALPDAQRAQVEREVRALIAATPAIAGGGDIVFPYRTQMLAFRKTDLD